MTPNSNTDGNANDANSASRFWQLLAKSKLYPKAQLVKIHDQAKQKGLTDSVQLAKWLVQGSVLTRYHATVLLAGRSGPFVFGDYEISNQLAANGSQDSRHCFRAKHKPTGHPVMLEFLDDSRVAQPLDLKNTTDRLSASLSLAHEGMTDCHELVQLPEFKFVACQFPSGTNLKARLTEKKTPIPIPVGTAFRGTAAMGEALAELHRTGHSHGNIQAENVWVDDRSGMATLVAQPLSAEPAASVHGDISDLGRVLTSMLLGRVVKELGDGVEVESQLQQVSGLNPTALEIVRRMNAPVDAVDGDGFPSMGELAAAIHQLLPERKSASVKIPTLDRYLEALNSNNGSSAPVDMGSLSKQLGAAPSIEMAPAIEAPEKPRRFGGGLSDWYLPISLVVLPLLLIGFTYKSLMNTSLAPIPGAENSSEPDDGVASSDQGDLSDLGESPERAGTQIAADDGRSLWAKPTDGDPLEFDFAPQGAQVFVHANLKSLLQESEGQHVIQALGPHFASAVDHWQQSLGFGIEEIDELLLSIVPDINNDPQVVSRVVVSAETLAASRWGSFFSEPGATNAVEETNHGRLATDAITACLELTASPGVNPTLIIGPPDLVEEIARRDESTPRLRREFESLRENTDREAHFAILAAPNYLLFDGQSLIHPSYKKFPDQLDQFLGDGVKAILWTTQAADDQGFAELRLAVTAEAKRDLRKTFKDKLDGLPQLVSDRLQQTGAVNDYWRSIADRMQPMLQFLVDNTRTTIDRDQVVANASLPAVATHNLVLGAELAIASSSVAAETASAQVTGVMNIDQALEQRMDLSIGQQSLEFALRDFEEQVNDSIAAANRLFKVKILGTDLQKDGITRNQQIRDFDESDKTIAELLTAMCIRANPVVGAEPNQPEQKLVWAVGTDPDNPNNRVVLITTRQAAKIRQLILPTVFRSK